MTDRTGEKLCYKGFADKTQQGWIKAQTITQQICWTTEQLDWTRTFITQVLKNWVSVQKNVRCCRCLLFEALSINLEIWIMIDHSTANKPWVKTYYPLSLKEGNVSGWRQIISWQRRLPNVDFIRAYLKNFWWKEQATVISDHSSRINIQMTIREKYFPDMLTVKKKTQD